MGASGFGFELEDGKLIWTHPSNNPELTNDQARTIALAMLAGAVEKLAYAVERHADRGNDG